MPIVLFRMAQTLRLVPQINAAPNLEGRMERYSVFVGVGVLTLLSAFGLIWSVWFLIPLLAFGALTALGFVDIKQTDHSILRNYPVIGHMRFLLRSANT